jgi:hypothetical protein
MSDTKIIRLNPTVDTSAYGSGDCIGGKQTLSNVFRDNYPGGVLQDITVTVRRAGQNKALRIYVFSADPTAATLTDNAAFVSSTSDLKILHVIDVGVSDYKAIDNSKFVAERRNLGLTVFAEDGKTLYAAFVDGGGLFDFDAATDLQVSFGILRD